MIHCSTPALNAVLSTAIEERPNDSRKSEGEDDDESAALAIMLPTAVATIVIVAVIVIVGVVICRRKDKQR